MQRSQPLPPCLLRRAATQFLLVRVELAGTVCDPLQRGGLLQVVTLDPAFEELIRGSIHRTEIPMRATIAGIIKGLRKVTPE